MTVTLENALQRLKPLFTNRLVSQTNDRHDLYGMIPESGKKFDGEQIIGALVSGYPASGGARGPTASVPIATKSTVKRHRFAPTIHWHPIEVYHDIQKRSARGGEASYGSAIALEVERAGMYIKKDLSRQAAGNGSAQRGVISSISGNVITITDKYDIVNFEEGQRLDIVDPAGDSSVSQLTGLSGEGDYPTVQSADPVNKTITLDKAPTGAAAADIIIGYGTLKLGTGADDTLTHEMYGLDAVISNVAPEFLPYTGVTQERQGTFQGIDPNVDGNWRSQLITGSGNDYLSPQHLQDAIIAVSIFGAEEPGKLNCLYAHPLQIEKFSDTDQFGKKLSSDSGATSIVRYPSSDGSFKPGGFRKGQQDEKSYLVYDNTMIKGNRFLRRDVAYYCNPMSIQRYVLQNPSFWTDMNGNTFHKSFNNQTSYLAELVAMLGLATELRNSSVRIANLKNDFT